MLGDSEDFRESPSAVFLKDLSIFTSGGREKCFQVQGRICSHLLDPRTGYPPKEMSTLSVIAPQTMDSEAWTKPCFINGRDWADRHKPEGTRILFG